MLLLGGHELRISKFQKISATYLIAAPHWRFLIPLLRYLMQDQEDGFTSQALRGNSRFGRLKRCQCAVFTSEQDYGSPIPNTAKKMVGAIPRSKSFGMGFHSSFHHFLEKSQSNNPYLKLSAVPWRPFVLCSEEQGRTESKTPPTSRPAEPLTTQALNSSRGLIYKFSSKLSSQAAMRWCLGGTGVGLTARTSGPVP